MFDYQDIDGTDSPFLLVPGCCTLWHQQWRADSRLLSRKVVHTGVPPDLCLTTRD